MHEVQRLRLNGGRLREVWVDEKEGTTVVSLDHGKTWVNVAIEPNTDVPNAYRAKIDATTHVAVVEPTLGGNNVKLNHGVEHTIGVIKTKVKNNSPINEIEGGGWEIVSHMAGATKAIHVSVGQPVDVDTPALDVEAMKMVGTIHAGKKGRVEEIMTEINGPVRQGQVLMRFSPLPAPES